MTPVRSTPGKALVFAALLFTLSGCLWLRYERMVTTHSELLSVYAGDAAAIVAAGLTPDDSYLRSLEYPLLRARDFSGKARARLAARPSMDSLDLLIATYGRLYDLMVPLRKAPPTPEMAAEIAILGVRAGQENLAVEQALLAE